MSMDRLDAMMRKAEGGVAVAEEEPGEELELTPSGVQINKASQPVPIYEAKTGEKRLIPRINLLMALKKRFNDPSDTEWFGKRVFSQAPGKPFVLGTHKCLLHPDQPERALYDAWGLPVCLSAHLASPEEVRRHMAKKHKSEYAQIKGEQERAEREEDRKRQQEMQAAMLAALQQKNNPVSTQGTSTSLPRKVRGRKKAKP